MHASHSRCRACVQTHAFHNAPFLGICKNMEAWISHTALLGLRERQGGGGWGCDAARSASRVQATVVGAACCSTQVHLLLEQLRASTMCFNRLHSHAQVEKNHAYDTTSEVTATGRQHSGSGMLGPEHAGSPQHSACGSRGDGTSSAALPTAPPSASAQEPAPLVC